MPLAIRELSVRDCFVPRPGCAFIDADIEQLELCTLAQVEIWLLRDYRKANQINSGTDMHCLTGAAYTSKSYEEFKQLVKRGERHINAAGEELWFPQPFFKLVRNMCKVPNFGKPGGMADTTLVGFARTSYGIKLGATEDNPRPSKEVAEEEARRLGRFWREANPNDQDYLDRMRGTRGQDGMYHVIIGHPSIGTTIRRGRATYCAACNSPFQGLGAIAAGEITFELQRRAYSDPSSDLFGCRLVVHAYDQWVLECPIERVTEAAEELTAVIETVGARKVPDVILRAPAAAATTWSKSAERVVTPAGQLLIWGTPECAEEYQRQQQEKKAA